MASATPDLSPLFLAAGQEWNVDPNLLRAVAGVESGGEKDPDNAVSSAGAIGRMQFMPATAAQIGVENPRDPQQAVYGAAKLLRGYLDRMSPEDALRSYNAGPDPTHWSNPETTAYVPKVAALYKSLPPIAGAATNAPLSAASVPVASSRSPYAAMSPDDFLAATTGQAQTAAAPAKSPYASMSPDDFLSATTGGAPASVATPALDATMARLRAQPDATPPAAPDIAAGDGPLARTAGLVESAAHGLSMGLDHPVNALIGRLSAYLTGDPRLAEYQQMLAGQHQQFQAEHPIADTLATAAGSVPSYVLGENALLGGMPALSGGGAIAGIGNGVSTLGRNALLGGASGYGLSDGDPTSAGIGAIAGAAAPVALALPGYLGRGANSLYNFMIPSGGSTSRLAQDAIDRFTNGPVSLNTASLVPGSQPTLAEAAGNPGISSLQRAVTESDPLANAKFIQRDAANAAARTAAVQGATGSDADIAAAMARRSEITPDHLFQPGQAADAQPVVDAIDGILAGDGGGRKAVQQALGKLKSTLVGGTIEAPPAGAPNYSIVDSTGASIAKPAVEADPNVGKAKLLPEASDPAYLYNSVRKQIGDQLDKADLTDASGRQSARELMQVRDALDNSIEGAAPGFNQYLSDYSAASRPIDAMKWLQSLNLTDAQGNVTLAKVQNAITNLGKQTSSTANATNDAASVTPAQKAALTAVRDDMLRRGNIGLGKAMGSNTVQNLATQNVLGNLLGPAKVLGSLDPRVLGGALGLADGGGMMAAAGAGVGQLAGSFGAWRNAAVRNRLVDMLLDPSLYNPNASASGPVASFAAKMQPYLKAAGVGGVNQLLQGPQAPPVAPVSQNRP